MDNTTLVRLLDERSEHLADKTASTASAIDDLKQKIEHFQAEIKSLERELAMWEEEERLVLDLLVTMKLRLAE